MKNMLHLATTWINGNELRSFETKRETKCKNVMGALPQWAKHIKYKWKENVSCSMFFCFFFCFCFWGCINAGKIDKFNYIHKLNDTVLIVPRTATVILGLFSDCNFVWRLTLTIYLNSFLLPFDFLVPFPFWSRTDSLECHRKTEWIERMRIKTFSSVPIHNGNSFYSIANQ